MCVWDVEKGEMVFHFTDLHQTKMTAMAFDEAGRRLITGANDGTVCVNFSNGQCLQQLKNEGQLEVSCITFIVESQNKLIVAGGWNRKVLVWRDEASSSTAPVEPDRVMVGHDEDILSIAYSAPNLLATSGYDGRLLIWNMDSAILKFSLTIGGVEQLDVDQRAMWKLLFLERRSQALVSASADGKLRFWNVKEGCMTWVHDAKHKNKDVVALTTEATNSFLFTGDGAGYLKVWDICQFVNIAKLDQRNNVIELAHWKAHEGCIASLDYIEKHRLILSASSDTKIKMWKFDNGVEAVIMCAGVLGETPGWNLAAPDSFEVIEQVEDLPPKPKAEAPSSEDADGFGDLHGKGGMKARPVLAKKASKGAPEAEPTHNTQDLIHQILMKKGDKKGTLSQRTFSSLHTHKLAPVSPRSEDIDSARKKGGKLPH